MRLCSWGRRVRAKLASVCTYRPGRAPRGLAAVSLLLASASLRFIACGGDEFIAATDGGPGVDSGATTDASADAPAIPFCSTTDAGFCSDFDQAPLPENWHLVSASGGATGVEDSDASVSPPSSYLAIVPAVAVADSGAPPASAILTSPALAKGQSHVAFDVRVDEISFPGTNALGSAIIIAAYSQGPSYVIALELHPAAANTAPFTAALLELTTIAGTTTARVDELAGLFTEVGAWYHVTLDFGIDTSDAGVVPASVGVGLVGGTPSTKQVLLVAPLNAIGGTRYLSVGAEATPPTGEAKIRFDNVTYAR